MKGSVKRAVIAVIIANCILIAIAICGWILSRFDYQDHLDEAVITVDEKDITLREFGYYIYEVEAFVQNQALLYNPENPKQWWNTHFSAGLDSQFVCDYAKKVAINTCIADEIYYREAVRCNLTLSSEEESAAFGEARQTIAGMSHEQITATGLDEAIIIEVLKKKALASKYALVLLENKDLSAYPDEPAKLVNWDGAYYLEEILPDHETRTNDDLLDKITLGKITVNMQ